MKTSESIIYYYGESGRANNIRKSACYEAGLEEDKQAALDDIGYNADLYDISNQAVVHSCP